jgi:hypothetical protein
MPEFKPSSAETCRRKFLDKLFSENFKYTCGVAISAFFGSPRAAHWAGRSVFLQLHQKGVVVLMGSLCRIRILLLRINRPNRSFLVGKLLGFFYLRAAIRASEFGVDSSRSVSASTQSSASLGSVCPAFSI